VSGSLLETVSGLLTRTYAIEAPLEAIGRYVIGDAGLRLLYRGSSQVVRSEGAAGARLLVRDEPGPVRACIYYPDGLIRALEARPPQRGVDETNVEPFAAFVEEIDHLLVTAERAYRRRRVTYLELELHANVSKYLVLGRFLAGASRHLTAGARVWLRHHLFERPVYVDPDPAIRDRYRDAARMSVRFLDALEAHPRGGRVEALRRFHRTPMAPLPSD
jgi:hypothetical protein